jgi:alkyl hydroperoxide reductase subunit F
VAIDGALFQPEVEARQVMAVPTVYLNGEVFGQGRMELAEIVAKIDTGAAARAAEKIAAKDAFDVLVVGGGPAGAAAAIYAARKGIRTGIAAERFGGQVLDTMGIENLISVAETEGPKLAAALEQNVRHYDVDLMNGQRVAALAPAAQPGQPIAVTLDNGTVLKSRSVILSTGARWRTVDVPGEAEYRNKGVAYCPHCDGPLFKGKRVAVIGGGNSGVEAAIDLAKIVAHVTLIEFDSQLRADAVLQAKLRSMGNVDVLTSAQTTEVLGDGNRVSGLKYKDRTTGEEHELALEGVFVQIGLVPNTEWLKGSGLEFGCELVSDSPEAAAAASEGLPTSQLIPVVVVPEDSGTASNPAEATPPQLIAPIGTFQLEQPVTLKRAGSETFAVLTKLAEQGPGYEIFEYVPVE